MAPPEDHSASLPVANSHAKEEENLNIALSKDGESLRGKNAEIVQLRVQIATLTADVENQRAKIREQEAVIGKMKAEAEDHKAQLKVLVEKNESVSTILSNLKEEMAMRLWWYQRMDIWRRAMIAFLVTMQRRRA